MIFSTIRDHFRHKRQVTEKVAHFNSLLKRVTYKHHYQPIFQLTFSQADNIFLTLQFTLHSSVRPGHPYGPIRLEQYYSENIVLDMSDRAFLMELRELIRKMEMHEIDEWLKFDDMHVSEPHPEKHTKRVHPDLFI